MLWSHRKITHIGCREAQFTSCVHPENYKEHPLDGTSLLNDMDHSLMSSVQTFSCRRDCCHEPDKRFLNINTSCKRKPVIVGTQ